MPQKRKDGGFTPQENRISAMPSVIASVLVLVGLVIASIFQFQLISKLNQAIIITIGLAGGISLIFFHIFLEPSGQFRSLYSWITALIGGLTLGFLHGILPEEADVFLGILLILGTIPTSIFADRLPSYILIILTIFPELFSQHRVLNTLHEWIQHGSFIILAIIVVETIQQLKYLASHQIQRLETINEFSRDISGTLSKEQVISLLNAAIQNAMDADSYYIGFSEGDEINIGLFYDDGEFFNNFRGKLDGSLSGWVIKNQKELFLPDLRKDVDLPGVQTVIIGKQKTSLSWMGVPMRGALVNGLIAIASYQPNAFDRSHMEMLSNLAQHATLALDNALRHEQVEEQSHLDSLTNVYTHGYFLTTLKTMADNAILNNMPLSVVMLDVDYFKQYNDAYGHLAGDEILTSLCDTIRTYVKQSDAIGRWGGEEFAIALPNANGEQALQVANRIRQTMFTFHVKTLEQKSIPAPTVSQGIALFPDEADNIIKLIDLADQRLYIAKERGRNQIEPEPTHWQKFEQKNKMGGE